MAVNSTLNATSTSDSISGVNELFLIVGGLIIFILILMGIFWLIKKIMEPKE